MLQKIKLLAIVFLAAVSVSAQKADWKKVGATYTRLPMKPASPMAKKYSLEVIMDSDGLLKTKVNNRVELTESISKTNALLVRQGKTPQDYPVDYDYYPVERAPQSIKTSLKLDGCQEVTAAPEFSVKLLVSGFNFMGNKLANVTQTINGVSTKAFAYDVTYVYKITYQVYDASGTLIREEILGGTDKVRTKRSSQSFLTEAELDGWWQYSDDAKKSFKVTCDNDAFSSAIAACKKQLNSELGYSVVTEELDVATAKDAGVYAEFIAAYTDASMGYNYLSTDKSKAKDYLLKATTVWEKELKNSNMTDKKARINAHMTAAIHANLAEAYCFLEDWAQCNDNLVKLKTMDLGGGESKKVEEFEKFKTDYEARVKANIVQ